MVDENILPYLEVVKVTWSKYPHFQSFGLLLTVPCKNDFFEMTFLQEFTLKKDAIIVGKKLANVLKIKFKSFKPIHEIEENLNIFLNHKGE